MINIIKNKYFKISKNLNKKTIKKMIQNPKKLVI